jgi:hypothetical protein
MDSLLIITGTMGAGKSAVLAEASDLLAQRRIGHAAIDLDALGLGWLPSGEKNDRVMYRNLESVCKNYEAEGVRRVLLARAMETREELEVCRGAVWAREVVVCRLTASVETMEQRVSGRETGILRGQFIERVAELHRILDGARLENFAVNNENRSLTEVAREVLVKAGWVSPVNQDCKTQTNKKKSPR